MYRVLIAILSLLAFVGCRDESSVERLTLVDFFKPLPTSNGLVSEGIWGDVNVIPRDTMNGIEDTDLSHWCYWDGNILKGDDGRYHMYACAWTQSSPHGSAWRNDSKAIHATSDNLLGPYRNQRTIYPHINNGGGHNVVGLRLDDGRYVAVSSERTPGELYVSDSADGQFEFFGDLATDSNGYYDGWIRYNELDWGAVKGGSVGRMANVMVIKRHDGRYMILARHCMPMVSDDGVMGTYRAMGDRAWSGVEGVPQFKMEDPTIWYSDGLYHIVVNHYAEDDTYHLTSEDGLHNWRSRGVAFQKDRDIFRYDDGTVNRWRTIQRPTVYVEDGEVKAFNFSVIDVPKGNDKGNDNHGSKIVIIPFDGERFGRYMRSVVAEENQRFDNTPPPAPWIVHEIGSVEGGSSCGYDAEMETIRLYGGGSRVEGMEDDLTLLAQEWSGDLSLSAMVMSQDLTLPDQASGLILRSSTEPSAQMLIATISNDRGLEISIREGEGQSVKSVLIDSSIKSPYWLRMVKQGAKIKVYTSPSNRKNWTLAKELEMAFDESYIAGVATTNYTNE